MEIFCIFENDNEGLFTVKYDDSQFDAWDELFENWFDIEFLLNFFESYSKILANDFWGNISIDDAVWQTREDAKKLEKQILSCEDGTTNLSHFFKPLDDAELQKDNLLKTKAYGIDTKWLRIYAVKLSDETYIITGGAIKLFATMREQKETQLELEKLNNVFDFLKIKHIWQKESLGE